jgi:glycosyltransferase involved in cell wall biosynthesis
MTKVIFVGSFSDIKGGVGLTCKAILDNPELGHIEWIKINSAMRSLPPPGFWVRAWYAALRLVKFSVAILRRRSRVLIFSSAGGSFVEKGFMAVLARGMGHKVTFCPRSGYLLDDLARSRLIRAFARLVFRASDRVVCQGPSWKAHFSPFVRDQGKLVVIPNLLDADEYLSIDLPESTARAAHVLMLGWIERNKGVLDLTDVVEGNPGDYRGITFHVCGEGSLLDELRARWSSVPGGVVFELPGWVRGAEKRRLLAEADIFLVLSYREGLPNALLETMAAGRAIVATRVGAIPDVIEDGVNGLLCEPGNLEQIHRAIQSLIVDSGLRARLGTSARERFLADHNLRTGGDKWLQVL